MSELNQRSLATLGELADEPVEQTGPMSDFVYVDISSIDRETKKITEAKTLTLAQAPSRAKQLLRAGDVLVSMTRPNLNAVALVPEQLDGAIGSTGFHALRSRWLRPEFLFRLVQSQRFVDEMSALVQGALYPAVRPKDIAAFTFVFETPAQQTRIVAKLEELLSDLDAGVAELKAAQKKLTQYRQSLLKAAVEGALTAEWRAKNTPSENGVQLLERILTERRARWEAKQLAKFAEQGKTPPKDWQKKYPEPVQPEIAGLPELPEGWVWARLGQLLFELTSGSRDWAPFYNRGSCVFVMAQNVRPMRPDFSFKQYVDPPPDHRDRKRSEIDKDDLLVTIVGANTGQVCSVAEPLESHFVCQSVALLRPVDRGMSEFLNAVLNSEGHGQRQFREMNYGAGRPHLSFEQLESVLVPLPPLAEQVQIVDALVGGLTSCDPVEAELQHLLRQSAAQRQNILRAAFSGQLVPQDPNDEPASVLLERIRAERQNTRTHSRKKTAVARPSKETRC